MPDDDFRDFVEQWRRIAQGEPVTYTPEAESPSRCCHPSLACAIHGAADSFRQDDRAPFPAAVRPTVPGDAAAGRPRPAPGDAEFLDKKVTNAPCLRVLLGDVTEHRNLEEVKNAIGGATLPRCRPEVDRCQWSLRSSLGFLAGRHVRLAGW